MDARHTIEHITWFHDSKQSDRAQTWQFPNVSWPPPPLSSLLSPLSSLLPPPSLPPLLPPLTQPVGADVRPHWVQVSSRSETPKCSLFVRNARFLWYFALYKWSRSWLELKMKWLCWYESVGMFGFKMEHILFMANLSSHYQSCWLVGDGRCHDCKTRFK